MPLLNQKMADGMTAIITGRQPLSDWEQMGKEWRSGGGGEVSADYEKANAASRG